MSQAMLSVPGYVVEALLGSGGSGQVWRARAKVSGDLVALKRLPVTDAEALAAARSEAAMLSALEHPHLIRLHEVVDISGAVVLVMDLALGGSLAELLTARHWLTPGEAITALAPVAAALAYAHNAGVVHGDISAANVLFTDTGIALLADLGVARIIGERHLARGTLAYLAPAVACGQPPTPTSDVFMLGALALQVLTGAPLWQADSPDLVLALARTGELGDVRARLLAASVPDVMCDVVERALAGEPTLRGTAAEFALDFRHSGTPVAVELSAGRHCGEAPMVVSEELTASDTAGRPAFARPGASVRFLPRAAPTHGVGIAPRTPARSARRPPRCWLQAWFRQSWFRDGRTVALVAIASFAAVAVAGAAVIWIWPGIGASAQADTATSQPSVSSVSAPRAHPTTSNPQLALDTVGATEVLVALDRVREQAFANRDVRLLNQVYVPGVLLAQDTALLQKLVPIGCGMYGVRTRYSHLIVTNRAAAGFSVLVTLSLGESRVVCAGTTTAQAQSVSDAVLTIELVKTTAGYLIAKIK